ncbi:hypothetical protein JZ751_028729 [Albula glossodonta]|uniref:Uncharacterized protein n=1 Tax=Albula glossodonta TaxID=121402 RepID=A0A8T2NII1_9TELE|nr:hypothetical protein JZ751_028729 [Albula glossodonta]
MLVTGKMQIKQEWDSSQQQQQQPFMSPNTVVLASHHGQSGRNYLDVTAWMRCEEVCEGTIEGRGGYAASKRLKTRVEKWVSGAQRGPGLSAWVCMSSRAIRC